MGRALKHQDEKVAQMTEENEILRNDKEAAIADLNSELERSRNELGECARSLVALEEEIRRLRRDSEKARGADEAIRSKAQLEHELRIRTEEIALLEREVIRLQSLTSRQQKEMVELERSVKDREDRTASLQHEIHLHRDLTERRGEDVTNLQHNVSTLTNRLKSQLDNLMRLQASQPGYVGIPGPAGAGAVSDSLGRTVARFTPHLGLLLAHILKIGQRRLLCRELILLFSENGN